MRVTSANRLSHSSSLGGARQTGGAGGAFSTAETSKTVQAAAPRMAQTIRGVDALLIIQGVNDATSGRAKAARRGNSLLDVLEELRLDVLAGGISPDRLEKLVKLLHTLDLPSGDAGLDAVLAEIDLRARVELAKLGHPAA